MTIVIIGSAGGLGVLVVIAALGVCCVVRRASRKGGGGGGGGEVKTTTTVEIKKADVDVALQAGSVSAAVSTTTHTAIEVEMGGDKTTKGSLPEVEFL